MKKLIQQKDESVETKAKSLRERGQSIVIIAAGMIVLLGFTGLAVDLGFLWVRDSQLIAAVDAAVLAGAPEIRSVAGNNATAEADKKAISFLHTNDIPLETIQNFQSVVGQTELGAVEYTITATWRVDTFFMRIFNFNEVPLTRSATAAYFPLVDIFASSRVEDGTLTASNQAVFGPEICTRFGDPFSPVNSQWAPGLYSYRYRILIPADYEAQSGTDIVRVELFDPDSINTATNDVSILHTQRWYNTEINKGNNVDQIEDARCNGTDQRNSCLINTGELRNNCTDAQKDDPTIFCNETDDVNLVNQFWFVRVDENRGPNCNNPGTYTPSMNTQTLYELYYFRELPDRTLLQTPLASYTGQTGDAGIDGDANHNTDIKWVSPGAFNQFGEVPTDCGSPNGGSNTSSNTSRCGGAVDTQVGADFGSGTGFEVDLSEDAAGIVVDVATGNRYLYLDVTTVDGSSENGFEIWAGPPSASEGVPAEANARNVYISDNPNVRNSYGVAAFAMGVLPMNSNGTADVDIPLIYVPPSYAGRTVSVSLFDTDSGTNGPVYFYFDTIYFDPERPNESDYYVAYGEQDDPERCFDRTPNCNDKWVGPPGNDPAFTIKVPTLSDQCTDPNDRDQADVCTPFYGGRLMARYRAAGGDTYVWVISLPSLPYLVK